MTPGWPNTRPHSEINKIPTLPAAATNLNLKSPARNTDFPISVCRSVGCGSLLITLDSRVIFALLSKESEIRLQQPLLFLTISAHFKVISTWDWRLCTAPNIQSLPRLNLPDITLFHCGTKFSMILNLLILLPHSVRFQCWLCQTPPTCYQLFDTSW